MKNALILVAVFGLAATITAKTFDRCSLARAMSRLGVPKSELAQWTCIAQHESAYRTNVVGPTNSDASNDYGIFQINDRYWCQPPSGRFSHNACGLSCNALLSDDINSAVRCARKIKGQQGWSAWSVWNRCNGYLPSIDPCF